VFQKIPVSSFRHSSHTHFPHITLRHRTIRKKYVHNTHIFPISPSDTGLSGKSVYITHTFSPYYPPTSDYQEKACPHTFPVSPPMIPPSLSPAIPAADFFGITSHRIFGPASFPVPGPSPPQAVPRSSVASSFFIIPAPRTDRSAPANADRLSGPFPTGFRNQTGFHNFPAEII